MMSQMEFAGRCHRAAGRPTRAAHTTVSGGFHRGVHKGTLPQSNISTHGGYWCRREPPHTHLLKSHTYLYTTYTWDTCPVQFLFSVVQYGLHGNRNETDSVVDKLKQIENSCWEHSIGPMCVRLILIIQLLISPDKLSYRWYVWHWNKTVITKRREGCSGAADCFHAAQTWKAPGLWLRGRSLWETLARKGDVSLHATNSLYVCAKVT